MIGVGQKSDASRLGFSPFQIMVARTQSCHEGRLGRFRLNPARLRKHFASQTSPALLPRRESSSKPWIFSSAGPEDRRIQSQFYSAFTFATNYQVRWWWVSLNFLIVTQGVKIQTDPLPVRRAPHPLALSNEGAVLRVRFFPSHMQPPNGRGPTFDFAHALIEATTPPCRKPRSRKERHPPVSRGIAPAISTLATLPSEARRNQP